MYQLRIIQLHKNWLFGSSGTKKRDTYQDDTAISKPNPIDKKNRKIWWLHTSSSHTGFVTLLRPIQDSVRRQIDN